MKQLAILLPFLLSPALTPRCIWDKDTLADELRGIPDAFELVTGRWFRHGEVYYRQRLETLPAHLEEHPSDLGAWDDLAVAHEALGDHRKAIEIIEQKGRILREHPNKEHQYRYHANLGTFYAHGALREQKPELFAPALRELEAAVAINPDAHFGRERFQIDLIRYARAAMQDPALWTTHNFLTWSGYAVEKHTWRSHVGAPMSFTSTLRDQKLDQRVQWKGAYTAVAGMLRFGGIEGAELYRSLGDLFLARQNLHLAWWAYRRAIERGHPARESLAKAVDRIEWHWREAKKVVGAPKLVIPTEARYRAVRENATAWLAAFQKAEAEAVAAGRDPSEDAILRGLLAAADRAVPPPER